MTTHLDMTEAITLDAGGTLIHPHPSVGGVYAEVMRAHGLDLDTDTLETAFRRAWQAAHLTPRIDLSEHAEKNWWKQVVRETLKGLGNPRNFEALFEELWHTFGEPRRWRLYRGVKGTLARLKKRGYRLVLLSNWDCRLRGLIEGLELARFFEALVISSEVGFEKPDVRIFRHVERLLATAPERLLHVGDSIYHDAEGAQKAGWNWLTIDHQKVARASVRQIVCLQELLERLPGRLPPRECSD